MASVVSIAKVDVQTDPATDPVGDPTQLSTPPAPVKVKTGWRAGISALNKAEIYLSMLGLGWIAPIGRLAVGDNPKPNLLALWRGLFVPILGILVFLLIWAEGATTVKTSLGTLPGPQQVWEQTENLWAAHKREMAKSEAFYQRQDERNTAYIAAGQPERVRNRTYTGAPTFVNQIFTSLKTVGMGFLIATLIAVPLGIVCGLSKTVNAAINPLIQLFKPVSPLAWLPIITMVVSAVYVSKDPMFEKSFIVSAMTVTLCSLWSTLINTAIGVSSIDKDLMNVGRVLQLSWFTNVRKVVLPSALPYIFTGLRLSLGVGWMVLIAAEMLAQNPGLGKFVWDEFQNGSSDSLARIIVAVLTIGIIGFLLDRVMLAIQSAVSHSATR